MSCLKKMYNLPDPSENYAYYRSIVRKQTKKSSNCIPMFGEHYCVHVLLVWVHYGFLYVLVSLSCVCMYICLCDSVSHVM